VNRTQVSVLEKRDHVRLGRLLQGEHGLTLETNFLLELSSDFAHQSLEGQLSDEQFGLNGRRGTLFWYLRIYRKAIVPGLKRWGFFTPGGRGAVFRAIFCAISCFLGIFWAAVLRAVCFVLAMSDVVTVTAAWRT
jgi:hypothetical protein